MLIVWTSRFEVGNELIDAQHRMLFVLCMRLELGIKSGNTRTCQRTMTELLKFADFHFTSEEAMMEEVEYPDLEAHSRMHARLLEQLRVQITQVQKGELSASELLVFLGKWLINHVAGEDTKISRHTASALHRPVGEELYGHYFGGHSVEPMVAQGPAKKP